MTGAPATPRRIPLGEGVVLDVEQGHYLVLEIVEPGAVARFFLVNADDKAERLSLSHTRISQGHLLLAPTSSFVSNRRRVLARICEDDVRTHDILTGSTCEGDPPGDVVAALEQRGVPAWALPDPAVLFAPTVFDAAGAVGRAGSRASVGDRVVLLAGMNLVAALSVTAGAVAVSVRRQMTPKG